MSISYLKDREDMCKVAHYMWDRRLTNAAGGNFAVRVDDDRILMSPSLMSERHFCELQPEDFLLINSNMDILEGTGKLSREGCMSCFSQNSSISKQPFMHIHSTAWFMLHKTNLFQTSQRQQ